MQISKIHGNRPFFDKKLLTPTGSSPIIKSPCASKEEYGMREIPIGEYIREHRQKKNMTIAKLADGICDASTLSRLE